VDVSNYSSELTPQALEAWKANGVGVVIVQAFPWNYRQYQQQQRQITQCRAAGLRVEAYIYDYLAGPGWRDACLQGLQGSGVLRVWADEEDVTPEAQALQLFERIAAITGTLQAIEQAGYTSGIYTGAWWWSGSKDKHGNWTGGTMNNTTIFQHYPLWAAEYDGIADTSAFTPFGGWDHCQMKQYAGTSVLAGVSGVDLDVT
jgi:GH25 family lysozyme M1 (1,4-beta-N-acetylmuramidase)